MTEESAVIEEIETPSEDNIEDFSVLPEEVVQEEVVEENVEEASVQPDETSEDDEGIEITLGDESLTSDDEEEKAPDWVRNLRKEHREMRKRNRELEKQLKDKETVVAEAAPTDPGAPPKLEDYDYDQEKFQAATAEHYAKKSQFEAVQREQAEAQRQQQQAWEAQVNSYEEAKVKLGREDYQDSEEVVMENLDQTQQGMLLQGMDNPALVVYAIGKNPTKAKELASIKDPVKFVAAAAKLEAQLKVTKRKAKPEPEKTVVGSSTSMNGKDSTLERLEAEALKTNDYTKVFQYQKQLRAKKQPS